MSAVRTKIHSPLQHLPFGSTHFVESDDGSSSHARNSRSFDSDAHLYSASSLRMTEVRYSSFSFDHSSIVNSTFTRLHNYSVPRVLRVKVFCRRLLLSSQNSPSP